MAESGGNMQEEQYRPTINVVFDGINILHIERKLILKNKQTLLPNILSTTLATRFLDRKNENVSYSLRPWVYKVWLL
jgi:hypothetical protein